MMLIKFIGLLVGLTILFSGCSLSVGESDFACPHVRSNIKCMPPSEIEKLDMENKLDWEWHLNPQKHECTLEEARAYLKLCGKKGPLYNSKLCKEFINRCIPEIKTLHFKGNIHPSSSSPMILF